MNSVEPFRVGFPPGRKLEKNRPQLLSVQDIHPVRRSARYPRLQNPLQFFHMCQKPAALYGKAEVFRSLRTPRTKGAFGRQAIKAVIKFNRIETNFDKNEAFAPRAGARVKSSQPVFVMPAGGPDAQHNFILPQVFIRLDRP